MTTQVPSKLKPVGAFKIADLSDIAETADAKIMTAAQSETLDLFQSPSKDDSLRVRDEGGHVFLDVTPDRVRHVQIDALQVDVDKFAPVAAAVQTPDADDRFQLMDALRRVFFKVTPSTIRHPAFDAVKSAIDKVGAVLTPRPVEDRLRLIDSMGRIFLEVTPARFRHVDFEATKATALAAASTAADNKRAIAQVKRSGVRDPAQLVYAIRALLAHFILYGQSLGAGVGGSPAISTAAGLSFAKMFQGGLRSRDAQPSSGAYNANFYGSLVGLAEATQTNNDGYGETGCYGMAEMIAQLLLAEDGIDIASTGQQLLFSSPAEGSQPISALQSGGTYWPRVQADVTNGNLLGTAGGLPYLAHALTWRQGERDTALQTDPATYKAALRDSVVGALRTYAAGVTGIDRAIPCVTYQLASHRAYGFDPTIGLALLELVETEANFALSAPLYPFTHNGDQKHLPAAGYRKLGGYEGIAWKRWLFDGIKPRHLKALDPVWLNGAIIVPFDVPVGPLTLDTTLVTNPGNYGFVIVDQAGAAVAITSVALLGSDRVLIKHSGGNLAAGSQLRYAWGTSAMTTTGPTSGPRGNLRDSQGDTITFHGDRMDNWSPIFRKTKG